MTDIQDMELIEPELAGHLSHLDMVLEAAELRTRRVSPGERPDRQMMELAAEITEDDLNAGLSGFQLESPVYIRATFRATYGALVAQHYGQVWDRYAPTARHHALLSAVYAVLGDGFDW